MKDIYRGSLVRLSAESPEVMAKSFSIWDRDSEAHRLGDFAPTLLRSEKQIKAAAERRLEPKDDGYQFAVRTLEAEKFIGVTSLWIPAWNHGDAWLGIYIGDRQYWGKGYGTDAMRLIVGYGFAELNLRRISLALHAFNERALKSYLKVGFQVEGRVRQVFPRDGVRYDDIHMGLLREDWMEMRS